MALRFVDGFDSYSSTDGSDLPTKYSFTSTASLTASMYNWSSTSGRFGDGGLIIRDFDGTFLIADMAGVDNDSSDTICFAFWFKCATAPSSLDTTPFVGFQSAINNGWSGVHLDTAGKIRVTRWASSGVDVGFASRRNVCDDNWHWIEVRLPIGNSVTVDCYIDGVLDASVSGRDTFQSTGLSFDRAALIGRNNQTTDIYIDDLIIYDDGVGPSTGDLRSSVDFPIGPCKIETARPNSTGANAGFTPLSSANYQNVDETVPDDDTTYVEASTAAVDTHGHASLTSTGITSIVAVQQTVVHQFSGLGDPLYVEGAVVSSGSTQNAGQATQGINAYYAAQFAHPYDPATSTRWTTAGLDAAEFGYAATTST